MKRGLRNPANDNWRRTNSTLAAMPARQLTMSDGLTVQSGRMRTIIIWIVTVPPFLIFGGAGLAKVMGAERMAQSIASYSLPMWC